MMKKGEKGFTVIEVLVSLAVFSIIVVIVFMSLGISAKSIMISDEQTTAESLARSQMEYVLEQPYNSANNPPLYSVLSDIPIGYIVTPLATRLDPKNDGTSNDDGIQKIMVTVKRDNKILFSLTDYKVNK